MILTELRYLVLQKIVILLKLLIKYLSFFYDLNYDGN